MAGKKYQTSSTTNGNDDSLENDSTVDDGNWSKNPDNLEHAFQAEEYKIWKKNTPFLYDILVTTEFLWPSYTVEWLPETATRMTNRDYVFHRFVVGTQTGGKEQNYLTVHRLNLPITDRENICIFQNEEPIPGYGQATAKIENYVKIPHDGDVNRARAMPQNSLKIATQSSKKKVFLFDISKHASEPSGAENKECRPLLTMSGCDVEGFGLSWNHNEAGQLLSSTNDGKIYLWDVNSRSQRLEIAPTSKFSNHTAMVGDVQWHHFDPHVFGSVGSDRKLNLWDNRGVNTPTNSIHDAHSGDINSISFNPFSQYIFLTGSQDQTVALWDMRNLKVRLHMFEGHNGEVFQVKWSPKHETVFASCGTDKRVMIWDMAQIPQDGKRANLDNNDEEPSELLFIHGGHCDSVGDFSWNQSDHHEFLMASVADNNSLHIWQMNSTANPYSRNYLQHNTLGEPSSGASSCSDMDS